MIVVDASAVPDRPSGVRTRLRGLYGAYAALDEVPTIRLRVARGSRLFEGLPTGDRVVLEECEAPGGPLSRVLRSRPMDVSPCTLWHAENLPGHGPAGVPTLLTLHDLRWFEPWSAVGGSLLGYLGRTTAARLLEPRWLRRCARVVTVSEASAESIERRLRVPRERIVVIANATACEPAPEDFGEDLARLRMLAGSAAPFFLAVGHLERRKRLELVVDALAAQRGRASLVLVGEGPEAEALRRRVARAGVGARVHFLGRASDAARRFLLLHAEALVLPSRIEGFAFTVHEALGHGCPVLAADLPCLRELPEPAVRRLPPDVDSWARAFDTALGAQDRVALGPHVAELAARGSAGTWDARARSLANLYRRVLEESAGRGA